MNATTWKTGYLVVTRLLAPVCAALALLFVFTEWKTMDVVRNGSVVGSARWLELYELSGMAAMGLVPTEKSIRTHATGEPAIEHAAISMISAH